MENARLGRKLHGFHRHFRGRFLLLSRGVLNHNEYLLWDLGFSVLAGWDNKNHPENYGIIKLTQDEIGQYLRLSRSAVCKTIQSLIRKGFWEKINAHEYVVVGYNISEYFGGIVSKRKLIDFQQFVSSKKQPVSNPQQLVSSAQLDASRVDRQLSAQNVSAEKQVYSQNIVSSKDNLVSSLRSDEEYKQLSKESGLSEEDLRAIDESLAEPTPINSDEEGIPKLDF